ncbi:hypothetical protein AX16_001141 [Volvariella volvacea WC 439]|nr:hypothetical protein AX16_001141 [Volvariella volvacea WC 439]
MTSSSSIRLAPGTSIEAERMEIDNEILRLERRLLNLRRRRNVLAPINQLPEEVLLRIIMELPPDMPTSPSSWIQFTHVCHQWRIISINDPLLWTTLYIPEMSPFWIKNFVLRSRKAPLALSINCVFKPKDLVNTLSELIDAVSRVTEFHCSDSRVPKHDVWVDQLDLSTSPLKILTISSCEWMYKTWKPTFNLQYLDLKYNRFTDALISPSLVMLKLQDLNTDSLPSIPRFYRILASLTNLRHLVLQRVLSQMATKTTWKLPFLIPDISILTLKTLELAHESENECARFLSYTTFPRLARLYIYLDQEKTSPTLSSLNKELINVWSNTEILTIDSISESHPQFILTSDDAINGFELLSSSDPDDRVIRIMWPPGVKSFSNLLATLPQDKLQSIEVVWKTPSESSFLTFMSPLSKFPSIQQLRITFDPKYWLYSAFLTSFLPSCGCIQYATLPSNPVKRSNSPTPACTSCRAFAASFFPDLRCLGIRTAPSIKSVDQQLLRRFLTHRRACGRSVDRLSIYHEKVEALGEIPLVKGFEELGSEFGHVGNGSSIKLQHVRSWRSPVRGFEF